VTQSIRRMTAAVLGVFGLALVVGSQAPVMAAKAPAPAKAGIISATLAGPPISGIAPFGSARYRERGTTRDFLFEAAAVNLPNGTLIRCFVNGNPVMSAPLLAGTARPLIISTLTGDAVPFVHAGDLVTITADGVGLIMSGIFH
jgi:hypothetical protein